MKTLLIIFSVLFSSTLFGQSICMVSADYQTGENIIVMWEWPASTAGMDSIVVYRKTPAAPGFLKIGGTPVGQLSAFTDYTAVTTEWSYYKIAHSYSNGTESTQSLWHRPLLLDYGIQPGTTNYGYVFWTPYEIEAQTSDSYIFAYNCYSDQTGLGNFGIMSTMPNTQLGWFDQAYQFNPNTAYMIEVELPDCNVNKANINTSRSNIKKQTPNAEVGIDELGANVLLIHPNPVEDKLFLPSNHGFEYLEIVDQSGKLVFAAEFIELENEFNLAYLNPGVYIVRAIDSNGAHFTNKLVKL